MIKMQKKSGFNLKIFEFNINKSFSFQENFMFLGNEKLYTLL